MQAAIYLRVSVDRTGEGLAVERQREDCAKLCRQRGWKPVLYCDNDTSAITGVRKEYQRMLADINADLIQAVVVWDLDRLHRRPIELEQFMELADEKKLALATVTGDVDLSTDNGRLFARIKGAVARAEVERKNARHKRALLQRAQSGKGWGSRAFGYTKDDLLNEAEAHAVRKAYDCILHGGTLGSIATEWNKNGLKTAKGNRLWTGSGVRRVLLNPRYMGVCTYNGDHYPAQWTAVVSEKTWNAVATILKNPSRKIDNSRTRIHLLTGLAHCGLCGAFMGVGTSGQKTKLRKVYTCKAEGCRRLGRDLTKVDEFITDLVVERLSRPDAISLITRKSECDVEALRTESEALHERKRSLALKVAKGLMSDDDVEDGLRFISTRLAEIEAVLIDVNAKEVFDGLIGADDVRVEFEKLPLHRQQSVIDRLMVITVLPAPRGRGWHPERIHVAWRRTH